MIDLESFPKKGQPGYVALLQELSLDLHSRGMKLYTSVQVRNADYDRAFAAMAAERADALLVVASVILATDRERIIQLAAKHRLPAIYDWREHVVAGGLMAYGGSVSEFTGRAAVYVDRILKGARAGDLPIQQPEKFKLVVNVKTAKALGLTIPPSILSRADQVIE
jgi:putative ABC transport system substrate-binding protein